MRSGLVSCIGAGLCLFCTEWLSRQSMGMSNPWFIAPMGASAVLLFAVPASPLAQPWAIIGGNIVAAFIGVTIAAQVSNLGIAVGLSVALSIGAMFYLRCLHPPGGAVALCAALGGPTVAKLGYGFVIWPVAINSGLLLLGALMFNNLAKRRYPHQSLAPTNPHLTADPLPQARQAVIAADLDAALDSYRELLDVSKEDLKEVLMNAENRMQHRRLAGIRCQDIMSRDVVSVTAEMTIHEVWQRLKHHTIKTLPVTTVDRQLLGIISLHDFFVTSDLSKTGLVARFEGGQTVVSIMTKSPCTARPEQSIADLATLFSDRGMHHLPVVNDVNIVVGMISQSDFVAALFAELNHTRLTM